MEWIVWRLYSGVPCACAGLLARITALCSLCPSWSEPRASAARWSPPLPHPIHPSSIHPMCTTSPAPPSSHQRDPLLLTPLCTGRSPSLPLATVLCYPLLAPARPGQGEASLARRRPCLLLGAFHAATGDAPQGASARPYAGPPRTAYA